MQTDLGFVRVCAAVPRMKVADAHYNKQEILIQIDEAVSKGAEVVCLKKLCIKG